MKERDRERVKKVTDRKSDTNREGRRKDRERHANA